MKKIRGVFYSRVYLIVLKHSRKSAFTEERIWYTFLHFGPHEIIDNNWREKNDSNICYHHDSDIFGGKTQVQGLSVMIENYREIG